MEQTDEKLVLIFPSVLQEISVQHKVSLHAFLCGRAFSESEG